jgi:hypothetical protein
VQKLSKAIVGFSGLLTVTMATAYPQYNVLIFSQDSIQQNFARFARLRFGQSMGCSLASVTAAIACVALIPTIYLAMRAEDAENVLSWREWRNNGLFCSITNGMCLIALVFGALAFWAAANFFEHST